MIGKSHKYQELSLLSQLNQQIIHLSKMIILYKITQKLKVVNVYIKMPYIILGISLVSKNNVFVTKLYIDYMYKLSNKGLATMFFLIKHTGYFWLARAIFLLLDATNTDQTRARTFPNNTLYWKNKEVKQN